MITHNRVKNSSKLKSKELHDRDRGGLTEIKHFSVMKIMIPVNE